MKQELKEKYSCKDILLQSAAVMSFERILHPFPHLPEMSHIQTNPALEFSPLD